MEIDKYPVSYVLPVDGPIETTQGYIYKNKETGEYHSGWFHCGCCNRDCFMSTNTPTCTGCANKLLHGSNDSPRSTEYIQAYCDYWNSKR